MSQVAMNFEEDDRIRELLKQYQPVIFKMKADYYVRDMLDDDWMQEGMIVLHRCSMSFDPSKGTSFGKFFKQAFQHHIFSLLRKQAAVKRQADTKSISYDQLASQCGQETLDPKKLVVAEEMTDRLILKETLEKFPSFCSKTETEVLLKYLMNQSIAEITEEMEKNKRSITMAYHRAVKKIIEELH